MTAPPAGPRALMVFVPPAHVGAFEATVYDDDGESNAYAGGGYCALRVTVAARAAEGACLEVRVARSGGWAPPYAEVALVLPPGDPRSFVGGPVAVIQSD